MLRRCCFVIVSLAALAACGSTQHSAAPEIDTGDHGKYHMTLDPANFVMVVDNPFMPLPVGAEWVYDGEVDGEPQRDTVTVQPRTKDILGIRATVVRDTVRAADGSVLEDTLDWYAQDRDGNVWYLGEDTKEYDHGKVTSTEGTWLAGEHGAQPGIVMRAHPKVGDAYRQEFDRGNAEDFAEVVRLDDHMTTPAGTYNGLLVTKEWTPLEAKVVEEKFYARGVGVVAAKTTKGADERSALVSANRAASDAAAGRRPSSASSTASVRAG
jgi:hypothetical protein